jgi:hypothetical protein
MAVRKRDEIGSVDRVSSKSGTEPGTRNAARLKKDSWQQSSAGKIVTVVLCVAALALLIVEIRSSTGSGQRDPSVSWYVCSVKPKIRQHGCY